MASRMTPGAWAQGARNGGIGFLVYGSMLASVTAVVSAIAGLSYSESRVVALLLMMVAMAIWGVVMWSYQMRSRGRVVLDCGPHPMWWLFVVCSVLAGVGSMTNSDRLGSVHPAAGYLLPGIFAVFFLLMAFGRLQVVEKGIWSYWMLIRWEKIASYHWSDDYTLSFRTRGAMKFFRRGAVPVPSEHRGAMDAALRSHVVPIEI